MNIKGEPTMNDYKTVQDLIIKAALYDHASTTISPDELIGGVDVLRITFSKNNQHSSTYIDLSYMREDRERLYLHCCKRALYKLLEAPYEEIEYTEETNND
jgi:hypothetical protein